MDKATFFASFSRNSISYELPNGQSVILYELTAGQRGNLTEIIRKQPEKVHIAVVAMSLDFIADDDYEAVSNIPGTHVERMADKILTLSGFGDSEESEKN